jgi:hypothetical protein
MRSTTQDEAHEDTEEENNYQNHAIRTIVLTGHHHRAMVVIAENDDQLRGGGDGGSPYLTSGWSVITLSRPCFWWNNHQNKHTIIPAITVVAAVSGVAILPCHWPANTRSTLPGGAVRLDMMPQQQQQPAKRLLAPSCHSKQQERDRRR